MGHRSCSALGCNMGNPIETLLPFAFTISDRNERISHAKRAGVVCGFTYWDALSCGREVL